MPDEPKPLSTEELADLAACAESNSFIARVIATVRDLERQLAEARKDTERLDWLLIRIHEALGWDRYLIDRERAKEAQKP